MNKKIKLYYKDGMPYMKRGGRFYKLKAQLGEDLAAVTGITDSLFDAESDALETDYDPSGWQKMMDYASNNPADVANYATSFLNAFNNDNNVLSTNPSVSRMQGRFEGDDIDRTTNTLLNAASIIPGAAPIVKGIQAGLGVGKAVGNLMPTDKYGETTNIAGQVVKSALNPLGTLDAARDLYKDSGDLGLAAADLLSFGTAGRKYRKAQYKRAEDRQKELDALGTMSEQQGNYRNDGIYAKKGLDIRNLPMHTKNYNVEIEDGEIFLGDTSSVSHDSNSNSSMRSKFALKMHGDKHGEDTDKDGQEGIGFNSEEGYIASNYLDLYGRPVKGKKGKKLKGKKGKTVAQEMEKGVKFLSEAEANQSDPYKNNPVAINAVLDDLQSKKSMAETNKFRRELEKMLKDDNIDLAEVINFITENAPVDDLSQEQTQAIEQLVSQQMGAQPNQEQQPMGDEAMMDPAMMEQMMAQQMQEQAPAPMAKKGKTMNRKQIENYIMKNGGKLPNWLYEARAKAIANNDMKQMGGEMMPPEEGQAPQNPSSDHMGQLMQQAQEMDAQAQGNMSPALEQLDPQVQEMFQQLPPEMQEQIMQLPPQQMEIAIMNAFEQMSQQAGMPQPGMEEEAMMAEEQGMPTDAAALEEQMMQMMDGGEMPWSKYIKNRDGYTNEYFGDKYRQLGGDLQMKDKAAMKMRSAHLPRPEYQEKYNTKWGTHMKTGPVFDDAYQTGGALSNSAVNTYNQYRQMGYPDKVAMELAQSEASSRMKKGGNLKPGMTVKFKSGGKMISGKVKKINPNGTIELY